MRTPRPVWRGAAGAALVCAVLLPVPPARGADLASTFVDGVFPEMVPPLPPTAGSTHRAAPRRPAGCPCRLAGVDRASGGPRTRPKAGLATSGEETRRSG